MTKHAVLVPICNANAVEIAAIGVELMKLSAYTTPPDPQWIMQNVRRMCDNYYFFGRLALVDGEPVGLIVGSIQFMLFANKKFGVEETVYVRDGTKFRASIAKQLLKALEHWAFTVHNAEFIRAGETSEIAPKAVDAFFRGQGYRKNGTLYVKNKETV